MVGSIVVVSVLTWRDLKATCMNMQCSSFWEFMLHKFKLGHNAMEATKNISCAKGEGAVNQSKQMLGLKEP